MIDEPFFIFIKLFHWTWDEFYIYMATIFNVRIHITIAVTCEMVEYTFVDIDALSDIHIAVSFGFVCGAAQWLSSVYRNDIASGRIIFAVFIPIFKKLVFMNCW